MGRADWRRAACGCLGALLLSAACRPAPAHAQPWRPADDDEVLATLERAASARALQQASAAASDANVAAPLARAYIERARREGDPRLLGYAQGLLLPWQDDRDAPAEIQLLQATILQSRHAFDAALRQLDRVLAQDPGLAQAWLTRAAILRVQGRYDEARASCAQLRERAPHVVWALCRNGLLGVDGHLESAIAALRDLRPVATAQSRDLRAWYHAELADQLTRAGRERDAEREFRDGLSVDDGDIALRVAYADLLLAQHRNREVLALTQGRTRIDALALRRLIAQTRLRQAPGRDVEAMDEGFRMAYRREQPLHQREEALFALDVRPDASRALAAARANWRVQREPIDALVLLRAARTANDTAVLHEAQTELERLGLQDVRAAALLTASSP